MVKCKVREFVDGICICILNRNEGVCFYENIFTRIVSMTFTEWYIELMLYQRCKKKNYYRSVTEMVNSYKVIEWKKTLAGGN